MANGVFGTYTLLHEGYILPILYELAVLGAPSDAQVNELRVIVAQSSGTGSVGAALGAYVHGRAHVARPVESSKLYGRTQACWQVDEAYGN